MLLDILVHLFRCMLAYSSSIAFLVHDTISTNMDYIAALQTRQQRVATPIHGSPVEATRDVIELSLMQHWCTKAYRVTVCCMLCIEYQGLLPFWLGCSSYHIYMLWTFASNLSSFSTSLPLRSTANTPLISDKAPEHSELLLQDTVDEGFRHGYLLDIVFALASLHLASETQDAVLSGEHVQRALQYQNRSVATMSEILNDVSTHNCNAVVMASILNIICTFISPLFTFAARGHTGLTADVMSSVTRYFRGIGFVMEQNMEHIKQGPFAKIFAHPTTFLPRDLTGQSAKDLQRLRRWMLARTASNNELLPMLTSALDNLEYVMAKTNGRSVFEWIAKVGPDFLQALKKGEKAAVAICMYWAVLMDRLEETWWAKYVGKKIIEDLSSSCADSGADWGELCRWCRSEVGLDNADHKDQQASAAKSRNLHDA